jgi:hypothetical protein
MTTTENKPAPTAPAMPHYRANHKFWMEQLTRLLKETVGDGDLTTGAATDAATTLIENWADCCRDTKCADHIGDDLLNDVEIVIGHLEDWRDAVREEYGKK